jgi:branched-chain amino acid transport system ATP-binding protein
MAFFEARALHKRFGDRVVLERIDLAFEEGALAGIMGPNGAGKTTCFNVLTGRYKPDGGQVVFAGEDITGLPPRLIARKGVSRSFQIMNVFDEFAVRDNIMLALPETRDRGFEMLGHGERDRGAEEHADAVLERVGLRGKGREMARSLSYGERRALEIGIALATAPRILFLDEPTSGLGTEATARLATLIAALRRDLTIVVIEHDMHFLFGLADRISVIHWGQVIAEGTPEALRANKWVQASNLGRLA